MNVISLTWHSTHFGSNTPTHSPTRFSCVHKALQTAADDKQMLCALLSRSLQLLHS